MKQADTNGQIRKRHEGGSCEAGTSGWDRRELHGKGMRVAPAKLGRLGGIAESCMAFKKYGRLKEAYDRHPKGCKAVLDAERERFTSSPTLSLPQRWRTRYVWASRGLWGSDG